VYTVVHHVKIDPRGLFIAVWEFFLRLKIVSFGDLFEHVRLHFNEEGSRRLPMRIAFLFLTALLDHRGATQNGAYGGVFPCSRTFRERSISLR